MKKKGFTLIELLVVIAIIALLMGILMPALNKARQLAIQLVCCTNLKGMGSAMLVYQNYNDDDFPRAGGPASYWRDVAIIPTWYGDPTNRGTQQDEDTAFGVVRDSDGEVVPGPQAGKATITSTFYLLVKHSKLTPKQFLCKGDAGVREWKPSQLYTVMIWGGLLGNDIKNAWDFGDGGSGTPYPGEVCSYAYQMPNSAMGTTQTFVIMDMSNPASPVAADRNPHLDKNAISPGEGDNSACHMGKGQNVLYKDGSAQFEGKEDGPYVGMGEDNIYTYLDSGGAEHAPTGHGDGISFDDKDAYLVNQANYLP